MGPRFINRGEGNPARNRVAGIVASMGPRFINRGEAVVAAVGGYFIGLQWGRGL